MHKFKILIVLLGITIICAAGYAAMSMSGGGSEFLQNYTENLKYNLAVIADKFNIELLRTEKDETDEKTDTENVDADTDTLKTEQPADENGSESQSTEENEDTEDTEQTEQTEKTEKTSSVLKFEKNVALENADTMQYAVYGKYLVCADTSSLMAFNERGESMWAVAMSTKKPILKVNGTYILLAEKGGRKVSVFQGNEQVYFVETENDIISASISAAGDVIAVTDKEQYKGSVVVYNKEGKEVFVWNSGSYDILDADIASSSRNVAVALLNTENGVKSCINFFSINEEAPYATPEFEDTLIFDISFLGEVLNAVGDNRTVGLSNRGKVKWTADYSGKTLAGYALDSSGYKIVMFDNSSAADIQLLNKNGGEKTALRSEAIPDCLDISANRIAYNNSREVLFGEYTGKVFKSFKTDKDIYDIIILNDTMVVAVYNGSLGFCGF